MINDAPSSASQEQPKATLNKEENDLPYHDHPFVGICISALDTEYTRCAMRVLLTGTKEEEHRILTSWMIDRYLDFKAATFFTMENLNEVTTFVYSNEIVRDFVLNVTERVCVSAGTLKGFRSGLNLIEDFSDGMIDGIENNHQDPKTDYLMAPPPVTSSLHIERGIMEVAVHHNRWMLVLYVMFMYIEQSEMFQSILNDMTHEKKKVEKK